MLLRNNKSDGTSTKTNAVKATLTCNPNTGSAQETDTTVTGASITRTLTTNTQSITWALCLDAMRQNGQGTLDTWHSGEFTNVSIKFTVS